MRPLFRVALAVAALAVVGVLVWQGVAARGAPDPTAPHTKPTVAIRKTRLDETPVAGRLRTAELLKRQTITGPDISAIILDGFKQYDEPGP